MSAKPPPPERPPSVPPAAGSSETLDDTDFSSTLDPCPDDAEEERTAPSAFGAADARDARAHSGNARASSQPTETSAGTDPLGAPPSTDRLPPSDAPTLPERYADRGLLGMGGMGEVRRVYDRVLDRNVAMKLVRADRSHAPHVRHHFAAEARATARLAHPGIVPVYDHGLTPDGRLWFTMREIRGETLSVLIERLHPAGGDAEGDAHGELPGGFRRLIDALERAARAIGYAHEQGMVHRDVKPSNILVGEHGEVMVVDWGLVRPAGLERGSVQGTPVYMAPEQARGGAVDARSDVYGLGMVLWELCAGHHPFPGAETTTVITALTRGQVPGPPPTPWLVPDEIHGLLAASTAADPALRPADGAAFANHLRSWLDGETRREKARARIQMALQVEAAIDGLVKDEAAARRQVQALQAGNRPWEADTTREAAWAAEDTANALARRIAMANREVEDELEAALIHDPDAIEAHAILTRRQRVAMADAEARGLADHAADLEVRVRRHMGALPADHPERKRTTEWLQGDGRVTLRTQPPGARVELYRYVTERRRLVPHHVRTLGVTPLDEVVLPRGSWLLELHAPGRAPVRYPVFIDRETHWDGVAPGEDAPTPIALPASLDPDDCYVPAGWVDVGGDPNAPAGLAGRRVWIDGFVIRRFPVTNTEYLAFLDDLVERGQIEAAERYAPRDRGRTPGSWGDILYGRKPDGRFELTTDASGDTWEGGWPVIMIDHVAAWAYARWLAERTGLPWRLPVELEWEKAAKGVDRRVHPWGDFADPTWCSNRLAFAGAPRMERVGTRPTDVSPYGVRDMAGAVVEWTASRMAVDGATPPGARVRVVDGAEESEEAWLGRTATWRIVGKGGSLGHDLNGARSSFRVAVDPWIRSSNIGIRVARSV